MESVKANKVLFIGQLVMILGSLLYGIELIIGERNAFSTVVLAIYAVAIVLMFIGWLRGKKQKG